MDTSLLSGSRTTHLRIVSVALACAFVFVLIGMNGRAADVATHRASSRSNIVIAGQPAAYAEHERSAIR